MDRRSFERLLEFLLGAGLQGLTLFGLAGEYYKLSDEERRHLSSLFLRKTEGCLARIVSVTDHSWELARRRAREAVDEGADALMVMPPFFLSPGPELVRRHVEELARVVQVPLLIQYSPNQTGLRLPTQFFLEMAEQFPQTRYVKVDSTPAGPVIARLVEESRGRIQTFVGYAGLQMVDAFGRGAMGCMPGCSLPEPYVGIYEALRTGDSSAAQARHSKLLPLLNFMMQSLEFIIQCEKSILRWRGIIESDYCRHPRASLTKGDLGYLKELLHLSVPDVARECT